MSYETSRESRGGLAFATGMAVGTLVCTLITAIANSGTDARVKGVQINNEQLTTQLSRGHAVDDLVLNDDNHTFTFHSRAQGGQSEICHGKYTVTDNVARATGPLACTQTVRVG